MPNITGGGVDDAHRQTDLRISYLEQRITEVYERELAEIRQKQKNYAEERAILAEPLRQRWLDAENSGDEHAAEYKQRYQKFLQEDFVSKRFKALEKETLKNLRHVNEIATAYTNGELPEIYSINYNGFAGSLSQGYENISFTLVDADTVKNLLIENRNLLPTVEVDGRTLERWNRKHITAEITQGILQGEAITKIADRFQNVMDMDRRAAIRNARTACTSAQNKGRVDMLKRANEAGINAIKIWIANPFDGRTRSWHVELNGKKAKDGQPFKNAVGEIMYPGDPSADPSNVYNCRCTLGYEIKTVHPTGR